MIVEVITPQKFAEFIRSGGESVPEKWRGIYQELRETLFQNNRTPRLKNIACYLENGTPADIEEVVRQAKINGWRSETPDPAQPKLKTLEQKKVVGEALQSFLGTQILADQGVPEYAIEARLLRRLVVHFRRDVQGRVNSRFYVNDEYGLSSLAMSTLYDNAHAPWVKRPDEEWHQLTSGQAFKRVSSYADTYRFAVDFHDCKDEQEKSQKIDEFKKQLTILLRMSEKFNTPANIISGIKIAQMKLETDPSFGK